MEWNEKFLDAFEKVKKYIQKPLALVSPSPSRPLIMYLTILKGSMGYVLGQHDKLGRKKNK